MPAESDCPERSRTTAIIAHNVVFYINCEDLKATKLTKRAIYFHVARYMIN
ncbi:hypothetical protein KFZ58_01655 [Virgibacillus sp. NKC19-16]|uniref:hypothetical protein n=1 Tax=Virgibacillus salidurans TaxID=2831673 RepID=UPI001F293475|nr:hypothetical protein [Virgibacillus sp. NKC19-16]UJL46690.1 hypothetical protein KFZ58_01655 [Virgibacillus sp. NKC19-16]